MSNAKSLHAFIDAAWNRGDGDAATQYLADDYTIFNDPGDPWEGRRLDRAGFRDRLVQSRAMAPDQKFTIVDTLADGDRVCICWSWRGTHTGDIAGIPATGREITMTGVTVYHFREGRICGHWQVADRLGIYQQLTRPQ